MKNLKHLLKAMAIAAIVIVGISLVCLAVAVVIMAFGEMNRQLEEAAVNSATIASGLGALIFIKSKYIRRNKEFYDVIHHTSMREFTNWVFHANKEGFEILDVTSVGEFLPMKMYHVFDKDKRRRGDFAMIHSPKELADWLCRRKRQKP